MEMSIQIGLGLLIVTAGLVALGLRTRHLAICRKARNWPSVEGTIESGQREVVADGPGGPAIILPVFAFSYQVAGEYYGGRFALRGRVALRPYTTDPTVAVHSFIQHMIGRKVQVKYNPVHPEEWFVANELVERCRVQQKFSRDFINFPPRDLGTNADQL